MLSNEATRLEPVYGPPPEGFRWAAHPAGPDWRTETERQCRRMHGTVRGRTRCTRQAVAALNRPRRVSWRNLCWGTRLQNARDKARHGTEPRGEAKPGARLTQVQVEAIRQDTRSARAVGADYGVSHTAVLRIRRGERWRAA